MLDIISFISLFNLFSFGEVIIFRILLFGFEKHSKMSEMYSVISRKFVGEEENSTNAHTNISRNFTKATREAQTK